MQGLFKRLFIIPIATLGLTGCSTLSGAPDPIDAQKSAATQPGDICPTNAQIASFYAGPAPAAGLSKRAWRDQIIGNCIALVDENYRTFVVSLHRHDVATNLAFDLTALTLTGFGSVAGKSTANALAAASTGVIGAGTALNKDVFYQKTLPAIIAQMDANRATIYATIVTNEKENDETAYSLTDAQHDIDQYIEAGSIDGAVSTISANAQTTNDTAKSVVKAAFVAQIETPDVQLLKAALSKNIKAIADTDRPTLDLVASAMGLTPTPGDTFALERNKTLIALAQLHTTDGLTQAAATIKAKTGKDYSQ